MASALIGIAETRIRGSRPTLVQKLARSGSRFHSFLTRMNLDEGLSEEIHVVARTPDGKLPKNLMSGVFANVSDGFTVAGLQETFHKSVSSIGLARHELFLTAEFAQRGRGLEAFDAFHTVPGLGNPPQEQLDETWQRIIESAEKFNRSKVLYNPFKTQGGPVNCRSGVIAILKNAGLEITGEQVNWRVPYPFRDISQQAFTQDNLS